MILNETYKMNNGLEIPKLALGTWLIDDNIVAEAVREAVKIGYRHIDTAQAYGNERGVGEGLRTCGVSRDEIFVTSKVAAENKTYKSAANSIDETLSKMKLDYIDMMIIHSPQPWKALEETYNEGKLKAIGVFNFHRIFHISSFLPETSWIHFQLLQITSLFLSRPYTVYYLY